MITNKPSNAFAPGGLFVFTDNITLNGDCRDRHPDEQAWALHLL